MSKPVRQYRAAGVALLGAAAIAVTPIAPPTPTAVHVAQLEARLAASVANIPLNVVYALANVPNSEVQAVNQIAGTLFHTGTWMVPSSTNIWGTDAADPGHWQALTSLFLPFPALSSVLGRQLALIAAAELPTSDSCDAEGCFPVAPVDPITGITSLDASLQIVAALTGLRAVPLIQNWFRVPLSELLSGYTFPEQVVSPSGPAYGGFGYPGTYPDPVTGEPLLPWSGQTFTWDPLEPFAAFYDSLTATPPPLADAVTLPTGEQVVRAFQALLAGIVVAFNPFVPGSPFWLNELGFPKFLSTPSIVKFIADAYPGNTLVDEWLTAEQNGTYNRPTQAQVEWSEVSLQPGIFTFDPATMARISAALAAINPVLPDIAVHSGLLGHRNLVSLFADIERLIGGGTSTGFQPVSPAAGAGPSAEGSPLQAAVASAVPLAAMGHSKRPPAAHHAPATPNIPLAPEPAASEVKAPSASPDPRAVQQASAASEVDTRPAASAAAAADPASEPQSKPVDKSGDAQNSSGSTGERAVGTARSGKAGSARTGAGGAEAGKAVARHRAS